MENNNNYLVVEYTQISETLRSCDKIFFQLFSGSIFGGLVSIVLFVLSNSSINILKIFFFLFFTLYLFSILFILYIIFIALPKINILKTIEVKLNFIGAYKLKKFTSKKLFFLFFYIFETFFIILFYFYAF